MDNGSAAFHGAAVAIILGFALAVGTAGFGAGIFESATSRALAPTNLGGGFVTLSNVQSVSGSEYWDTYCANPAPSEPCTSPIGIAYFPPNGNMILTQEGWSQSHFVQDDKMAIVEIDPAALENVSYLHVNCGVGFPYYPGFGTTVWVPCYNQTWTHNSTLLGFDGMDGAIVDNLTIPFTPNVMTSDPRSGEIFAGPGFIPSSLNFEEIDPSTGVVASFGIPGLSATETQSGGTTPLVFNPATGDVLFAGNNDSVIALDPATGQTRTVAEISSSVYAMAVDPGTNRLLLSTLEPSSVMVLNGATYKVEAAFPIPNCFNGLCASPNDATQIVLDPAHGDAYLVATVSLQALNLSTLSVVGTLVGYGDGSPFTAAYSPLTDRIFGTYVSFGTDGPGFMAQLDHSVQVELTSLFWLPPSLGLLISAALVGLAIAILRFVGPPVPPTVRRPRTEPYIAWD